MNTKLRRMLLSLLTITITLCGWDDGKASLLAQMPLPATEPLTWDGDLASRMVDGVDRFLLRKLAESPAARAKHWTRDTSSPAAYNQSVAANRTQLAEILGMRDQRDANIVLRPVTQIGKASENTNEGENSNASQTFRVLPVRWNVMDGLTGSGLLLEPNSPATAQVVLIPDASQTAADLARLPMTQRLASGGCRIVIPTIVGRTIRARGPSELTDREFLYRSAFELGRHLIGYELHKILAAVSAMDALNHDVPVAVAGWGDGGMLALYAGALEPRIDVTRVSGYFGPREKLWQEPLDRNVFGLLDQFGDAELATLIAPRTLLLDMAKGPQQDVTTRSGAPYTLTSPTDDEITSEIERSVALVSAFDWSPQRHGDPTNAAFSEDVATPFAEAIGISLPSESQPTPVPEAPDSQERVIAEMDQLTQRILVESPYTRKAFMSEHDTSSIASHAETIEKYRDYFREEVIGEFSDSLLNPRPRTRQVMDAPTWTGYEVVLDVFPDVFAYGILLIPKNIPPGERRPTVVCQHGLEGRPQDVIAGDKNAYHDFAAKLAERGFVTFAPQNLYIFQDRFRTLQRKANPVGKTLFSVIVPQHQQIVDWLAELPQVDPDRIAFYGLSYGGKSAMRIPPLVSRYCLSICSADFNDWVWKNASTRSPYSYVWTGEYEIFEWNLGSTFNYSEMAALIAPRPFMVERGHFDGVAPDERVAYEFAKVRHLYQAQLGIGDRCEIEWFVGPHTIHGKGTFSFLHRHLQWPEPKP